MLEQKRDITLTCPIDGFPISPGPAELRHRNSDGAAAEQDAVAFQAVNLGHGRVDPRYLAPPYLHIQEEHAGKTLWLRAAQVSVDEG